MDDDKPFLIWLSILGAVLVVCFLMVWPAFAQQQQMCAPFPQFREQLATQFGEREAGTGVMLGGQSVIILFASPEGATWTIVGVNTSGIACVLGAGERWDAGPLPTVPGREA